ncbi:CTSS [Cordylochernes scorpioides]|uniref:CTSS n=1 Tax=Cordylochernes scorpioides TaxID=51811 RepID=A0ABY6JY01_9ARAC|nr:CTSS [Cordylochernes scorpioides]
MSGPARQRPRPPLGAFQGPTLTISDIYRSSHGKNYKGLEDQARKAIFEENLKKIVQHNLEYELGMHSYHLGINKYSDWVSVYFI